MEYTQIHRYSHTRQQAQPRLWFHHHYLPAAARFVVFTLSPCLASFSANSALSLSARSYLFLALVPVRTRCRICISLFIFSCATVLGSPRLALGESSQQHWMWKLCVEWSLCCWGLCFSLCVFRYVATYIHTYIHTYIPTIFSIVFFFIIFVFTKRLGERMYVHTYIHMYVYATLRSSHSRSPALSSRP